MDHLVEKIAREVQSRLLALGLPPRESGRVPYRFKDIPPLKPIRNHMSTREKLAKNIASYIDHTLLKADASRQQLEKLCEEAIGHKFAAVCVNSSHIGTVSALLKGSEVKPIAVVGFPLGAASTPAKAFEAKEAIREGAREIDMVINIGALKDTNYGLVMSDIYEVVEASKPYPVKVILETAMLTEEQKIIGCVLSKIAGAAFVKTSTGFGPGGATVEDIALMRRVVGPTMGVKASGGVRTAKEAISMIEAGATRIGTSHGVSMVTGKGMGSGY